MGGTISKPDIYDIIATLSRRIDSLETGGKPLVGISEIGVSSSGSLAAGNQIIMTADLVWTSPTVTSNPMGQPYFTLYIDNDGFSSYSYGGGSNVDETKHLVFWWLDQRTLDLEPSMSRFRLFIQNQDSVPHTYYLWMVWPYLTGSSSSF